jgi:hypothetical protein
VPAVRQRPAKRADAKPEREPVSSEQNPASRTARASSASERGTPEGSAKPKDLFGGLD